MAEGGGGGEKTEAPTPRRRERAREKGNRMQSRELQTALAGVACVGWGWAMLPGLVERVKAAMAAAFRDVAGAGASGVDPWDWLAGLAGALMGPLLLLMLVAGAAGIAAQALSGGVGFAASALAPKLERLDPVKGFKRIFGMRGLVELGKALAKALVLIGAAALLLWAWRGRLAGLSSMALDAAAGEARAMAVMLAGALALGLLAIAAVDVPWQAFDWLKKLRMSKQELKEEAKDAEGAPEMKARRRAVARELARRGGARAMAEATVVLVNPTHFAVALRWDPERDAAPVLLAKGRGLLAEAIRQLAAARAVPVLHYPGVARALFFTGRVGAPIRPDLYAAVATILAFVLRAGVHERMPPDVEPPESARYDGDGVRQG